VTIHAEASSSISATLRAIKAEGSRAGLALKPGSSIEDYTDYVDDVDMFLIMTVEPGFGGQKFMSSMMEKVARTRTLIGDRAIWLQVDGGISLETIEIARHAGADTFVAGSAVFNSPDPAEMITQLRALAESK
jgi:ribulose-phosphate 3-epimerase